MIAPALIGLIFMPESPRWLLSMGMNKQASKIVNRIRHFNGLDSVFLCSEEKTKQKTSQSFIGLFKNGWRLSILSMFTCYIWFSISLTFYGQSLGAAHLPVNIFLGNVINGSADVLSYIAVILGVHFTKISHKTSLIIGTTCSGACLTFYSLINYFFEDQQGFVLNLALVIEIAGKFFSTACFALIYFYGLKIVFTSGSVDSIFYNEKTHL